MEDDKYRAEADEIADAGEPDDVGDETVPYDLNEVIENLCKSKAAEFRMLGYEQVEGREIWDCISDKYNKTGVPGLHQVVNDILSLKVTQFMNWMTMRVYKGTL